ncbi:MAG TPA: helix-hairpin-helix domain-containing protein, partial [Gemmatimonadaceae bacterium]|nr:helix-hairpin-helix domain-containing protein [Gemmatimonadaceae bacterium]
AALARSARELVETGQLRQLERLRGTVEGWRVLATVPGIGPTLAERIHDALGIESLEELESAAHDGRLATIDGLGAKRLRGIREALASRLRTRPAPAGERVPSDGHPDVSEMLDVDREYRERAAAGRLPTIAPRRFNPTHERWLPVLHTTRGGRQYTALFSNTARAHAAHKTHDWVVLYHDDGASERQHTVITAARGPLKGQRVIAGLESECERWYAGASGG